MIPGFLLLLFFIIPVAAIFSRSSIPELIQSLQERQVSQAILLSLSSSLLTTITAIFFGTPLAYYLALRRSRNFHFLDSIIDLPTVLPPSVAGVALLMAFGRKGLIGMVLARAGITIPFTFLAVVLAQLFIASPLYIKSAVIGFSGVEKQLIQSAELDGATDWQVFRHITVPLAKKSLLSGAIMTWARALGEFGATMIFAGNYPGRTQTMPLAIYIGFEINLDAALTLSIILVFISFLTLILAKSLFQFSPIFED